MSMRLLAEEAGQVIVTLEVTLLLSGDEHTFRDSITVQVCFCCGAHTHS